MRDRGPIMQYQQMALVRLPRLLQPPIRQPQLHSGAQTRLPGAADSPFQQRVGDRELGRRRYEVRGTRYEVLHQPTLPPAPCSPTPNPQPPNPPTDRKPGTRLLPRGRWRSRGDDVVDEALRAGGLPPIVQQRQPAGQVAIPPAGNVPGDRGGLEDGTRRTVDHKRPVAIDQVGDRRDTLRVERADGKVATPF